MAIRPISSLYSNVKYPLFNNRWILYDVTDGQDQTLTFSIEEIDLPNPFPNLKTESLPTGNHMYTETEWDKEWSITVREDVDASILTYMREWLDSVYDADNYQFNLEDGEYSKNFMVLLYRPTSFTASDQSELAMKGLANTATTIANNVVSSAVGRLQTKVNSLISASLSSAGLGYNIVQSSVSGAVNATTSAVTSLATDAISSLLLDTNLHEEEAALTYYLNDTIVLGIESLSLSYEKAEPIRWKIKLASDSVSVGIS